MLEMIDAGAEEVEPEDESLIITGTKEDFGTIQAKLEELSITPEEASLERIPNNRKEIDDDTFEQVMKLIDVIEGDDDVVQVYHNMDVE